jgi:hypothetical protein
VRDTTSFAACGCGLRDILTTSSGQTGARRSPGELSHRIAKTGYPVSCPDQRSRPCRPCGGSISLEVSLETVTTRAAVCPHVSGPKGKLVPEVPSNSWPLSSLLITCVPGGGSGIDLCGARHVVWRESSDSPVAQGRRLTEVTNGLICSGTEF